MSDGMGLTLTLSANLQFYIMSLYQRCLQGKGCCCSFLLMERAIIILIAVTNSPFFSPRLFNGSTTNIFRSEMFCSSVIIDSHVFLSLSYHFQLLNWRSSITHFRDSTLTKHWQNWSKAFKHLSKFWKLHVRMYEKQHIHKHMHTQASNNFA